MKLSQDAKDTIIDLKLKGFSSRNIARMTGYGKTTVNDVFKDYSVKKTSNKTLARILFLDVETTADIVATFGRRNVNISEGNIIQQGNQLISAAFGFYEDDYVVSVATQFDNYQIDEEGEKEMLKVIVDYLEQSDVVVIHNARFDLGTIQQRMLHYGMGRLPTVKVVDTLQIARKYLQLRSNKLDSITKYFNLSNKMDNEGIGLWIKVQAGCPKALETMREYNAKDVEALKDVYRKFVPLNSGVNFGLFTHDSSHVCTSCGSDNVSKTGRLVHTSVSSFEEFECNDCGAKMRGRVNVIPKEQRKNLLVAV
jgi:hypothetical protein